MADCTWEPNENTEQPFDDRLENADWLRHLGAIVVLPEDREEAVKRGVKAMHEVYDSHQDLASMDALLEAVFSALQEDR